MNRNLERRRTFVVSYLEGLFYALMVGSAETYALVFAVKRGVDGTEFGILATLPILFGALSGWLIPSLTPQRNLKVFIMAAVFLQILGLAGFILASIQEVFFPTLLISLTLYWIGGMASGPLWLDWISGWLPSSKLRPFLSRRNAFVAIVTLISYISASYLLIFEENIRSFTYIFAAAAISRILSLIMMSVQGTHVRYELVHESPAILGPIQQAPKWIFAFLCLIVGFKFASGLASPFFTPYMLSELELSLRDYVWITSIPFAARAACLAQWGRVSSFFPPVAALKFSLFIIAFVAFLWSWVSSPSSLIFIEILSGFSWAAFDLFTVIIIQQAFRRNSRSVLGLSVALMNLAALLAAYIGGKLLESGLAYQELFLDSAYLRFGIGLIFLIVGRKIPELDSSAKNYQDFLSSTLSLRPSLALVGRLIPIRGKKVPKD